MNHGIYRLFALSIIVILLLTSCQSKPESLAFVPITGGKEIVLPALVTQTQKNVLDYILASSRLDNLPQHAEWKLESQGASEHEYRFRSGDWTMLITLGKDEQANQRVILFNLVENASWTGYVTPEGRVVDTTYAR